MRNLLDLEDLAVDRTVALIVVDLTEAPHRFVRFYTFVACDYNIYLLPVIIKSFLSLIDLIIIIIAMCQNIIMCVWQQAVIIGLHQWYRELFHLEAF